MRRAFTTFALVLAGLLASSANAACPAAAVPDAELPKVLRGRGMQASPTALIFKSGLERDEDGSPLAYHRGNVDASPDPGLDHLCNAGDVLEFVNGQLVAKYYEGGSIGSLEGVDQATGVGRTKLCKIDYIAIRDADFPACGPGHLCMRWYGVVVEPRSCGYNKAGDRGCGVPQLQKDAQGKTLPYYISQNKLVRPDAHVPFSQSDFADAGAVPFIVMPGGVTNIAGQPIATGDLVAVVWHGKTAYGVIGDTGPAGKIGEASHALLAALGTSGVEAKDPATTIIFPRTAKTALTGWPLTAAGFRSAAQQAIAAHGGLADLRDCPGLKALK